MQEPCGKTDGALQLPFGQLIRYQEEIPQLFHTNQILDRVKSLWRKVWNDLIQSRIFSRMERYGR